MSEYFDISPIVSSRTAVFPGDQAFQRRVAMAFSAGDNLELSSVLTTMHIGAHADAPSHYDRKGVAIHERSLRHYLGPCEVKRVSIARGERVGLKDLGGWQPKTPRVLLSTGSFPDPEVWQDEFNSFSPEVIEAWHKLGVMTIGIDTPSIDPARDRELLSHQAVARCDLAVLEGLVLDHVPEGVYTLVALPLRWEGVEASPVRAILLSREEL